MITYRKEQKTPYIVIGDDKAIPWNTKMEKGWEFTTTINVWGGERSMKDVKTELGNIESALAKDIGDYEFYGVSSIEAKRVAVDLVQGIIIFKYRMEVQDV